MPSCSTYRFRPPSLSMLRRMKSSHGDWRCCSYSSCIGLAIDLLLAAGVPFLHCQHFVEPAYMAVFSCESRCHKCPGQLECEFRADNARAQRQHVHVVVLHALMCRICV